jgi:N utilization substance protein A
MRAVPRTEFAQALKAIATERGLDPIVILDTIKHAIIAAYKRDAKERGEETEEFEFDAEINPINGEAKVLSWPLEEPDKKRDVTPPGFGRIAAQTAKQVIHQKIREAEKDFVMHQFSDRVGTLISGMVLRFDGADVHIDLGRTEALMPKDERVPNERLTPNQRYTFLLKEIVDTPRGKQIILSRSDSKFVLELFKREVPEISSGSVVIKLVAREPGVRTKIAVFSSQSGVDPVGSCVGQKGVRVQAVTNELGGEKVDIISYSEDINELIKSALSPAEGVTVKLDKKNKIAKVKVSEDQLSLAIGRDGQNARLAAKLTGVKIEIEGGKSDSEKKEDEEVKEAKTEVKKEKPKKKTKVKASEDLEAVK